MPKTKIKPAAGAKTLHALFIAINEYEEDILIDEMASFPKLSGCVADADAMYDFLKNDPALQLNALKLYDKQATKTNIIKGIREHLGKAKAGDSVLFFYSGHGGVEEADPELWPAESDGRLEGIVCYYTDKRSAKFILADKELRYLLAELSDKTNAHILSIFDCCHSGDNTRAALKPAATRKQVDLVFPVRPWSDFIFGKQKAPQTFARQGLAALLPEGQYVQIAACESNEPALEDFIDGKRQGVLTAHLLRILRETAGHITYQDLVGRVRNQIRYRFSQRPKIYTPAKAARLANAGFLQKTPDASSATGRLDPDGRGGYLLNLGVLHRVKPGHTTVEVQGLDKKWHTGRITKAELDHATVAFAPELRKQLSAATMTARVKNLDTRRLRIRLIDKDAAPDRAQELLDALNAPAMQPWVEVTESAKQTDYDLLSFGDMFYLTRPDDWFRPLVLPALTDHDDAADRICAHLQQIARWHFTRELKNNADTPLPLSALKIEFLTPDDRPLALRGDTLQVDLQQEGKDGQGRAYWTGGFKVRLTNQTPGNLYVAAAYLSPEFGVNTTDLLEANTATLLDAGESKFLFAEHGEVITGSLDDNTRMFNRPAADSYLQFIISSDRFDTGMLQLEPLPDPSDISAFRTAGERSLNIGKPKPKPMPKGWNAATYCVRVPNPEYNRVDMRWLQRSVAPETGTPYLTHFLLGLYFDKKPGLTGALLIKKNIKPAEKGLVWSAALAAGNFWAHWRRDRQYDKMVAKNPKLPRFLAEGDSWFQHPLLTDIIDNIGRHYPVYCLSAAGDTIEHYFKEGDLFKKLPEVKPALILLSGGGNDILGDDMPKFFQDHFNNAPEGERPDRFFRNSFFEMLDKIQGIYRQIFERLNQERPGIPVLVHSYDYPRPLKPGVKKSSWIGERFDEKHIAREGDRTAVVHLMIDEFNKRLKSVAGEFKNVHYLDLRGRVADNQWDDEIHPNDVGYERVSAVFLRKIREVI